MNGKKVMVEVREGSRTWAVAMHEAGKRVVDAAGCQYPQFSGLQTGWTLYVEPPKPIEVQPGTFPWAVVHVLAGRAVRRTLWTHGAILTRQGICSMHADDLGATDWVLA